MDEQNTNPTQPPKLETTEMIKQATDAAAALKAENDRKADLLKQDQELYSRKLLGGDSQAGQHPPDMTPEQLKKEKAAEFFKGSIVETAIRKYG